MSRLDEIEARLSAATPGPWAWRNTTEPYLMGLRTRIVMAFRRMGTQGAQPQFRDEHGLLVDAGKENINDFPDAALIAHAPGDLAALVAVVKAIAPLHVAADPECPHAHHDPTRCPDAVVPCAECDRDYPCSTAVAIHQIEDPS